MKRWMGLLVASVLLGTSALSSARAEGDLVAQRRVLLPSVLAAPPKAVTMSEAELRALAGRMTVFSDSLPAALFDGDKVKPSLRQKAMDFAQARFRDLGLKDLRILDMLFVGSLASYEHDDLSDVDVHVIIDPASWSGDPALLRRHLRAVNDLNEFLYDRVTLFGRKADYTFYLDTVENRIEPGVGIYSLFKETWLEPPKAATARFSRETVEADLLRFVRRYNDLVAAYAKDKKAFACGAFSDLREEVRLYRRKGIAADGIRSTENIVYRALRRIDGNLLRQTESLGLECENIQGSM